MKHIFLIAGEASGDRLGALLMRALRRAGDVVVSGVGGEEMAREGLNSLFPFGDLAVMGLLPVLARLPRLVRRIEETARAIIADPPDCLVLIDAPDFTHRVARRVRAARPDLPIVDYVCPTVWAWRPGRARRMRAYVDHVLAVLPFEPDALARLGGPPCDYVGHPLIEHIDMLAPIGVEKPAEGPLLILPGSRRAEIRRMMPVYGQAAGILAREFPALDMAIPVVPHVEAVLREELSHWPVKPRLLSQQEKFSAFRAARAALVTSGVATLELALADVPMAVGYRVAPIESLLRFLVTVDSIVLPNLIVGSRPVPEFFQGAAAPGALADAVSAVLREGPSRSAQLNAFKVLRTRILSAGAEPSARAARIVLGYADSGRRVGTAN
ncbi:lipid-A-disaccharide synthase [Methylocystis heyeri]|uniref:lipid-A-disaccharide synthase n=1 Tax=Methylocystis heyeri TaxID=391905 RepID=UPI0011346146